MENSKLVYKNVLQVLGESLEVLVYAREDGRHFALTSFAPGDHIINDGSTRQEALEKHCNLLPLALHFRRIPAV